MTGNERRLNWICHILDTNWLLKDATEGRIEWKKRRGRRRKSSYWMTLGKMELERGSTRLHCAEKGCGPFVRQTTERLNELTINTRIQSYV